MISTIGYYSIWILFHANLLVLLMSVKQQAVTISDFRSSFGIDEEVTILIFVI